TSLSRPADNLTNAHNDISVFFFQAEDGIRDRNVTGVQTCALPILNIVERRRPQDGQIQIELDGRPLDVRVATTSTIWGEKAVLRSEERRVGKECRSRGGA